MLQFVFLMCIRSLLYVKSENRKRSWFPVSHKNEWPIIASFVCDEFRQDHLLINGAINTKYGDWGEENPRFTCIMLIVEHLPRKPDKYAS